MGIANYDVKKVNSEDITVVGNERIRYFDGIGKDVKKASDLETAITLSGLNFEVVKYPIAFMKETVQDMGEGNQIVMNVPYPFPKQFATVRTDTLEPLGVVGKNYEILQNIEAFDFLNSMTGKAKFETAGSYGSSGAKSFITMSTEPMNIMGDEFIPYILFMNSFDGSGSVKVMFTPIRVFCSNCLTRAIKEATNKINIRHSNSLKGKLEAAQLVLLENSNYLNAIKAEAEKMAITRFTSEQFKKLVESRFVVKEEDSATIKARNEIMITSLMKAYNQADLQNYNDTVYKAVQAFADFESHKPVFRNTSTIMYKNIDSVRSEMPLTNLIADQLMATVNG